MDLEHVTGFIKGQMIHWLGHMRMRMRQQDNESLSVVFKWIREKTTW